MATAFQPSFDDLSTPLFDVTFAVLDLETTGGSPRECEITEIGAVKYQGGDCLGTFQTLVNPGSSIPPTITILTGITQAMVIDAPAIGVALPTFLEFLGDSIIVGHNIRFDMSFLDAAANRLGYGKLDNKTVDTAALARRLIRPEVRNLRLQTLAGYFRSPVTPNHRALEDARATAHVFHALLERVGSMGVTNLDDLLDLPKAKGAAHFSKIALSEHLPRCPGVYVFRDRNGRAIYVGKASNLRARVRQYFYGDQRRSIANLMRELHEIDHRVCRSVLEAEITELRLIHAHRPRYNRRSKPPKSSHFVKLTKERYPRLSIVRTVREDGLAYLGPFRSRKSAEVVMTAIWDAIPIRRCTGSAGSRPGKCAPAQLGLARCPCDGSLDQTEYEALVSRLIRGISDAPSILLDPLEERMNRLADSQRYEEAAWIRDRHDALAAALESRRRWRSLVDVGWARIEDREGLVTTIDHGVFVECKLSGDSAAGPVSIDSAAGPVSIDFETTEVPLSVEAAEEAAIIWRWLVGNDGVRLVDCTGSLVMPTNRVVRLRLDRRAA